MLQLLFAGEHLQESFPVLQQVFLASLKDSSVEVRRTALEAVSAMMPWLDDEHHIALFKDLVPLTIQVRHPFLPIDVTGSKRGWVFWLYLKFLNVMMGFPVEVDTVILSCYMASGSHTGV